MSDARQCVECGAVVTDEEVHSEWHDIHRRWRADVVEAIADLSGKLEVR
jgi:hypothetical protein